MHIDRQNRIKNLFSDALELEPVARDSFLDRATTDDPTICIEVRMLIDAHERATGFLIDPTIAPAESVERAGQKIGRYTLIKLIGEGGFGSVYLAQQREPIARQVAVKIIKLGMDTRQVIARFEAERQALAMMKHPSIAAVFDAGSTDTGRPFFVMEFVEGLAITEYCDRHRLTIEQRLHLFIQVCAAVQHAHSKGVIHRDLKPGNLMVTVDDGTPLPKIIDFGIAKATSGRLTDFTVSVDTRQFVGTPQYMSPEQAGENADDVDTRSDVYSLGVVLYELLAGVSPFDSKRLQDAGIKEWQRIIREEEPPKPSTRLASLGAIESISAQRRIEPGKLSSRLSGDLDWVVLKSLEKDRDRRYGSAAELAADIQRHLHDEPVLASPPGRAYLARKFIRRHRVGVWAASLVALAIACGGIGLAAGIVRARTAAHQARDAARQAQAISDFMQQVLTSVNPDSEGADVRLVEVLDDASDSASQRFAGYPLLEAQVRDMLGEVYSRLGMAGQAKGEFQKAMDLWRAQAGFDDARAIMSERNYVGSAINSNQSAEVVSRLPDLLERANRVFGPADPATLDVQRSIGLAHLFAGRLDQAEQTLLNVRAALAAHGGDDELQIRLLRNLIRVKRIRSYAAGPDVRAAIACEMELLAKERLDRALRAFGPKSLITLDARLGVAAILEDRHQYLAVADVVREVLGNVSDKISACHNIRLESFTLLAMAMHRLGDSAGAADLHLKLVECARQSGDALTLAVAISDALPILDRGEHWIEGESLARELAQILEQMGGGHGDMLFNAQVWTARFVSLRGRADEADVEFQRLARLSEQDGPGKVARARLELFLGSHLRRRGAFAESELKLQAAANLLDDFRFGTNKTTPDDVLVEFIALYTAWGKADKALEYQDICRESVEHLPIDPR